MKKNIKFFWNTKWRKLMAGFFAFIMVFQAISGIMDVAAYELGKVQLDPITGDYYNKSLYPDDVVLNKATTQAQKTRLKKEATVYNQEEEYDPELEITEKRTSNSKTYKLPDGTYVNDTYFEPIHKKEGKEFVDIDNTLENTSKQRSKPIYENKEGLYTFKVENNTALITNEKEQTLFIINNDANLTTCDVKENVILYSEVYENIDMEYRLHGNSVATNFFINGTTSQKEINLMIDKGNLKVKEETNALLFLDEKDNVVYSYSKPLMYDGKDEVRATTFSFVEDNDNVNIKLVLDNEWMNNSERTYPIMMSNRAADESAEINIDTAYNRSASPSITSTYYDLYVGYEDGATSGGTLLGVTRSYVRISGMNLGADKEIVSGTLKMWKRAKYSNQWNELSIGKTSGYIAPKDATWNNRPSVTQMSTVYVRGDAGWQDFDVKSYVEDIYKGKNTTIEIKATNESSAYTPNVFSSESGTGLPKLTVTYKDAFDVNPNLPIDTFDTEMRIFSILDKGWEAFSFDGIARPDSQIIFDLVERGKDDVIQSETSKGNANKYFVDPIYITNYLANTQKYSKTDVNYTTDYIYKDRIPKFDTPYEYKVKVKGNSSTSTKEFRTDSFIKYKVKNGDNLKNLASYYGLTIDEIKEDNHLKNTNIIKEDDILLLRFKKNNDKVSKDIYTPPVRTIDYKAKYVNRGPRCSAGICPVVDPVNSTTGNYYYEGIDFNVKDADDFDFYRYYNSTGPQLSNMFGNGFTTPIESYISYDKNGNILYFAGDGKIFEFKKTASGFEARPQDRMKITSTNEKVTITDLDTEDVYQFDVYGYLENITSKEGIVTTITYDKYGLITAIKVGEKTITFTYNESKLVKNVTLPNSAVTSYKYDTNRNLVEFTDTKGNIKKYTYDNNNYLKSIADKNGNVVTQNTYDNEGRVTKQIDGNGNVSTLTYGDHKTTIVNADGSTDVYNFNDQYDTLSIVQDGEITSKNTYDANRNITSSTDEDGKVTKHTYDNRNNVIKTEYPDGTYEEYQYDGNNNIVYQKDKEGNVTENTFSGNDLISTQDSKKTNMTYVYDDKRRVIKETDQFGASKSYTYVGNMIASIIYSNGLIESFEYDANGNTVKESDNQGKITTYIYNANNEMTQKNYYDGTNEKWTYDANGNISVYQDRIGGVTTNTYDKNNNLIKSVNGNLTTSKKYNEMNQLISETDVQGLVKTYTYDLQGNKASETDVYGNTTKYEYDANDNIVKTIDAHGNEESNIYKDGNLISSTGKDGLTTTYEYDSLNREIKKTNPNETIETKAYKGLLLVEEKDGKDTKTKHFYDAYDREIKTVTTYTDGIVSTTQNAYDIYGNIIETNIDGTITKNTYDVYKQLISTTDALGNVTKKEYDLDGNVVKEIDALGNAIITKYDGNQNIISITDKNGNTETKSYNTSGQLISETDVLGFVKTYTYNNKGQVFQAVDPYNKKITYKYDEFGNQIETKLEDQVIETKDFDHFGREIYVQTLESRTSNKYDVLDRKIETANELTGLTTYTTYDEFGNVVVEKDSEGLATVYEYDNYNRKVKTTDVYGRIEEIIYDVHDHAISTKAFDGTNTSSKYDAKGNLVESKDALGKVTKNTYDALNRVVKEEAGSKITETIYDANGQVIDVKNSNNNTSTKTGFDNNGNVIETVDALNHSVKTEYDAKNQVIATVDANGNRSTKEYDAYGNVIKETDALGHAKQKVFNAYGLVEKEVDERGFDVTYEYNDDLLVSKITDSKGYTLTVEYNDRLQKIKEINANDGITQYEYDAYGRENKVTAPNGKVTEKEYDTLGNIIKERSGKKTTENEYDELGRLTKTTINDVVQVKNEYNELNQIVKSYDANDNVSTFKYDINNLVVDSNEKGFISEKEYDVEGNIIKQIDNKTYVTENVYDAANRFIETKVNGKTTLIKEYDPNGNEIKSIENGAEVRKSYNETNNLFKVEIPSSSKADEFVAIQTIEYDESGNPLNIIDANGNVEEKKYDANNNVIEEINKNGVKTLYEFDGLNNVTKVQNHEDRYVQYTYDKANNLTIKNINNKYAEFKYDEDGNLLSEENEYGYKSRYSYDVFGKKVKEIKPDGTSIKYTYDSLGNKLTENKNTFTYDSRNNVLTATNKEGTVKNTYDAFNNKTLVADTKGKKVSYEFNKDNKVSNMKYGGVEVTYSYNENGLLDTVKKDNSLVAKYEYNNRNEVIQLNQNNTVTNKTYDDMGRVLTQKSVKDGKSILDASYNYDANDNVVKEIIDGQTNTYEFDAYDELTKSSKYIDNKLVNTTYKHDVFGNQIENSFSEGKKVFKYNDKNQVESIETEKGINKYSYDDNGNVSKKINDNGRVDLYTYDDLNQLTKLEQGQYTYDYKYDAEKERISQKWTDTKDYHYDKWYNYTEPLDVVGDSEIEDTFKNLKEQAKKKQDNGNVCTSILSDKYDVTYFIEPEVTEYTLGRNQEYTQVLTSNDTINVYGNTLLESNNESIITAKNESVVAKVTSQDIKKISYRDYGQTNDIKSGNGYNSETLDQTGLIYLRARYYDPSVSRFVQIDNNYDGEKQNVASQNKYVYTMNNPYKYVDRNGNWSLWGAIGNVVKKVVNTVVKVVTKVAKTVVNVVVGFFSPATAKNINKAIDNVSKKVTSFVNGIGSNASKKGGGSKAVKPPVKKVKVEAKCPEKKEDISLLDVLLNCISWVPAIEQARLALDSSNLKINGFSVILNHLKEGNIRGMKITVSGARDVVKKISGLATGPKMNVLNAAKKTITSQIQSATRGFGLFMILLDIGKDFITYFYEFMLGMISAAKAFTKSIGTVVYNTFRVVGSTILRTFLMPFCGPFAWLITLLIDVSIDIIGWFVDLKSKVTELVEWIASGSWGTVIKFGKALKKII